MARDWGTDRYATALAISRIAFADDSVETVVIATGAAFPDALAASGLAGVHGSPLLLVGAAVTADLIDELDRLGTTSVVLIGGEKAISADVFDALHAAYDVRRVSGADRYETAAAVAREIADLGGVSDAAYFVRGDESADALSVSPFAYRTTTPVLLIATGGVPTATGGVIDELGIAAGWIIGGPTAVNQTAAAELEKLLGVAPVRLNGIDRYATAAAVAQMHVDLGLAGYGLVGIATGTDFADALGGGAAVGTSGGVLLLTRADALPSATRAALEGNLEAIDGVR
ncbi:MAG: cell wall-binding repeat-containing protein, partial [Coriobacteriia bacterium]|nr:cell wall-binding repeat-containing protein [Coriobacteriia bacterium]